MDIQEMLRKKKEQMASKRASYIRTVKPEKGKHLYRILPTWRKQKEGEPQDPTFWHDYGQHFVRAKQGGKPVAFVCTEKTFDQTCDVCVALGKSIANCEDDDTLKLLKQANSSDRFLLNVLHLSNTEESKRKEPLVLEVGSTVFNSILDIIEDYGDITDLEKGLDLIIKREGSGLDTEYKVLPSPKGARKIDASVMEKVTDLDAFAASASETQKAKAFANLSAASGILLEPPKRGAGPVDDDAPFAASESGAPKASSMMSEGVSDAEFDEIPGDSPEPEAGSTPDAGAEPDAKSEGKGEDAGDDEDELDALIANLD